MNSNESSGSAVDDHDADKEVSMIIAHRKLIVVAQDDRDITRLRCSDLPRKKRKTTKTVVYNNILFKKSCFTLRTLTI